MEGFCRAGHKCSFCLYVTVTVISPAIAICSPVYVVRITDVSFTLLLGNRCALVSSEITDTAAPVSTSMDKYLLFTSNATVMGLDDLLLTLNKGAIVSSAIGSCIVLVWRCCLEFRDLC